MASNAHSFDMISWLTGYILGVCGKPLPLVAKKEPTAYSYNGVVLPKLPEWDRNRYPYAVIWVDSCNVVLSVSAEPVVYWGFVGYYYENDHMNRLVYTIQEDNFVLDDDYDKDLYQSGWPAFWTNHDIIDTDSDNEDRVQMAASEPAPDNGKLQYCLYNGTKMIVLPEWDKETYPYAMIVAPDTDLYPQLIVASAPYYLYFNSLGNNYLLCPPNGAKRDRFIYCGTTWIQGGMFTTYYQNIKDDWYIWANHDIIDRDGCIGEVGSVYREGSEPIPIYE